MDAFRGRGWGWVEGIWHSVSYGEVIRSRNWCGVLYHLPTKIFCSVGLIVLDRL